MDDFAIEELVVNERVMDGMILYYIPIDSISKYLHKDGEVRDGTLNEENEYTGYFIIKREAESMLNAYKKLKRFEKFLDEGNTEIKLEKETNDNDIL